MIDNSYVPRPHDGLRCRKSNPVELHLAELSGSVCESHGVELESVLTVDTLTLRDNADILACPVCFEGRDGIDQYKLNRELARNWDSYQEYFKERQPPEIDQSKITFD